MTFEERIRYSNATEYLNKKADERQKKAKKKTNTLIDLIFYAFFFTCGALM